MIFVLEYQTRRTIFGKSNLYFYSCSVKMCPIFSSQLSCFVTYHLDVKIYWISTVTLKFLSCHHTDVESKIPIHKGYFYCSNSWFRQWMIDVGTPFLLWVAGRGGSGTLCHAQAAAKRPELVFSNGPSIDEAVVQQKDLTHQKCTFSFSQNRLLCLLAKAFKIFEDDDH